MESTVRFLLRSAAGCAVLTLGAVQVHSQIADVTPIHGTSSVD
jgi:hypothetical protein